MLPRVHVRLGGRGRLWQAHGVTFRPCLSTTMMAGVQNLSVVVCCLFAIAQAYDYDVVVYESTPGGVMTAVAGKQP